MGQELLVNYNVPHYGPLDWLVSVGFVPPERWQPWEMIESALPKIRRDGPFSEHVTARKHSTQDSRDSNPHPLSASETML